MMDFIPWIGNSINQFGFLAICVILIYFWFRPVFTGTARADAAIRRWAAANEYEVISILPERLGDRIELRAESQQTIRRVQVKTRDGQMRECFTVCGGRFLTDRSSNLETRWR